MVPSVFDHRCHFLITHGFRLLGCVVVLGFFFFLLTLPVIVPACPISLYNQLFRNSVIICLAFLTAWNWDISQCFSDGKLVKCSEYMDPLMFWMSEVLEICILPLYLILYCISYYFIMLLRSRVWCSSFKYKVWVAKMVEGVRMLSSPPLTGASKSQLFTEQLFMRPTWRLAEKISNWKCKGTPMRCIRGVDIG